MRQRWDTDERDHGITGAGRLEPDVRELAAAMAARRAAAPGPDRPRILKPGGYHFGARLPAAQVESTLAGWPRLHFGRR